MNGVSINIWAVFIGFGVLQGVLLSVFLFSKKGTSQLSNRLFACLLIVICHNLFEYLVAISGLIVYLPHLLFTSYPGLFLIGPIFYFYCTTLIDGRNALTWKSAMHLIPFLLLALVLVPFYLQSVESKLEQFTQQFSEAAGELPISLLVFILVQFIHMFGYILASHFVVKKYVNASLDNTSDTNVLTITWLQRLITGFGLFIIAGLVIYPILMLTGAYTVEFDYAVVLILSAFIHVIAYSLIANPILIARFQADPDYRKYQKSALTSEQTKTYIERIRQYFDESEPFRNSELKVSDVASALDIPTHHLSQAINQELNINFFDFTNEYRVKKVKELLMNTKTFHFKIFAIALEAGFNNKTTFNRVFKRHVGITPSQFRYAQN